MIYSIRIKRKNRDYYEMIDPWFLKKLKGLKDIEIIEIREQHVMNMDQFKDYLKKTK